ncbi:MAG: imidazole glycerol phosphate synthase subunit HisH [Desulfotomaculum sp.]|nr:imidazole glycerol phosphate synthase subunit HisH [Desulfotomaculum sp.]MCL0081597.1 imidazole glycerol phosphate synthase subunit HisH [Peptococcaceae bacterium]
MIAIIDYGMGNLRSVQKGFEKVGYQAEIVTKPERLADYQGVVLPGVGAFADAMKNLKQMGMVEAIQNITASNRPFLGICLGQQLLFESSEEWGETPGLGIFAGQVRRLPSTGLKVPHIGWNQIELQRPSPLLVGIPNGTAFYFVHSYYVAPADQAIVLTTTEYGIYFASIVGQKNTFGIQFHPEKSSRWGLEILKNFGKLVDAC